MRKKGVRIFFITLILLLALPFGAFAFIYFAFDMPSWQRLSPEKLENLMQTSSVYDSAGTRIASLAGAENRTVVPLSRVPENVKNAFIAAEDLRFYQHSGFDVVRMAGALLSNLKSGGIREGASTITQQLVKLTHLTSERTWRRKFEEIYLAYCLEQDYSKDEILEMYLNTIYFGRCAYGIQAAAQAYYGVDVEALTLPQAASLAAAIKAPSAYAPHLYPENNRNRRSYILRTMAENGMISEQAAQEAIDTSVWVIVQEDPGASHGWFVDAALTEAEKILGITSGALLSGGYEIHTTLDAALQAHADALYADASLFPKNAADGTPVESAFVCVDANTGAVAALVGGRDYTVRRGLNRATQMRRQPGSALKPLCVYGPALERGYTTASLLWDEPEDFGGYTPRNSSGRYYGAVTIRTALSRSLNIPAVRLLQEIGLDASQAYLERFGIPLESGDRNLSLALGSMAHGVTPLQLAAAYGALAGEGVYRQPYLIQRILSSDGAVLYAHTDAPTRVISEQNAYLLTSLLSSVVTSGTGTRLRDTGVPTAAKTGTVSMDSGNRDIWTAAYTREYALCVWMGYDTTTDTHRIPSGTTGGSFPASLASAFIKKAYAGRESAGFAVPQGMTWLTLDTLASKSTGSVLLASNLTPSAYRQGEVFLASNHPTQVSDYWDAPAPPGDLTLSYDPDGNPTLSFTATAYGRYRLEREQDSDAVVLLEQTAQRGEAISYTDTQAEPGLTYVYRVVPISERLWQEGTLLQGESVSMLAQSRRRAPTWLDRLLGPWDTADDDAEKSAPAETPGARDEEDAINEGKKTNLFSLWGW